MIILQWFAVMSDAPNVESILNLATECEVGYDWLGAVQFYEKALRLMPEDDSLRMGQAQEKIGYALRRAAMQAENQEEFKKRTELAIKAYEKAEGLYEKLVDHQNAGRMPRCSAIAKYLSYWLTTCPSEKRKVLDECLELEGKALAGFSQSGEMLEYGRTYNELSLVFFDRAYLEWDREKLKEIVERGMQWGEKAVAAFSKLADEYESTRAHAGLTACLTLYADWLVAELEESDKTRLRSVEYLNAAVGFSEKVGDAHLLGFSHFWWGRNTAGEESIRHFEKVLECGKLTRDNFLIAEGLDNLAYGNFWKALATEDPEKRIEVAERAIQLYEKGQHHFSIISFINPRGGVIPPPAGHAEHYYYLARWETDAKKRRDLLLRSEEVGMEALKLAEDSDIPLVIVDVLHVISKTLAKHASSEQDLTEKRGLLASALKYREKEIQIREQLTPFDYWNLGSDKISLAGIKSELAYLQTDPDNERKLLEEASLNIEEGLKSCGKIVPMGERQGETWFFAELRDSQDACAAILSRLCNLTSQSEYLRKAIEISQKAVESANKLDLMSRVAESEWKIAKAQDVLGEHSDAAQNFEHASKSYVKAAEKIPQLKDVYQHYALYMQAWSEIEKAKHHHARQEYGLAKEHFGKAASLHNSLKQWSYLAPNYFAWTQVEGAEDLSRSERSEEALQAFREAADLFEETKKTIQTELVKIEGPDEKQMATSVLKATDIRREYCMARIALEEAKILDRKGDHYLSSEKYGSAAETFEKISHVSESERDRKELKLVSILSRAWQKMTQAEAEASPSMYMEASQLFEQAKEFSPNERARMLALGHSRFCRALEAGTRFADTRDATFHAVAEQQLEIAAEYYVKAGFQNASEYSEAMGHLFDAYVYMDDAKKEKDPEKKAKIYAMAEKVLQSSAGSFMKAEHPEKMEQVQRLLEKVKKERELATSLNEMLHAPSAVSTTVAFVTPTPNQENATGLERFEHADIQASVITSRKELKVGEDFEVEIELVNAGKGTALLTKITDLIPESFELKEKPESCRVEGSYLNMKGRRLDSLKTEEVKLVLKPKAKGVFELKPRVLYLDENGKYRTHEPEATTVTVSEMGISGWLKGPGKAK